MDAQAVIMLNVGGRTYTTHRGTLCKVAGSRLAKMFNTREPNHVPPPMHDGHHFIDRDGAMFRYILMYLRDGLYHTRLRFDPDWVDYDQLIVEADFYGLDELSQACTRRVGQGKVDILAGTIYEQIRATKGALENVLTHMSTEVTTMKDFIESILDYVSSIDGVVGTMKDGIDNIDDSCDTMKDSIGNISGSCDAVTDHIENIYNALPDG